jgi:RNA polymerase primary sigma factor
MKSETSPRNRPATEFQIYLRDIHETPLLSSLDERILAERIATGDPSARDHLVRANLRLVVKLARGYLGRGLPLEDLVAEGNLGLLRAVEGFDGSRDIRFPTYASFWIKQSIRNAVIKQGRLFRLPAYMVTLVAKWRRATAILTERLGRQPTPTELGEALRLSKKQLGVVLQAIRVSHLRNSPEASTEDEDGLDHLIDERSRAAAELLVEADNWDRIFRGLGRLDEREAMVIRMRFGLDSFAPMTLHEVGEKLGMTRDRVRQLERQALQQLMEVAEPERSSQSRPNRMTVPLIVRIP